MVENRSSLFGIIAIIIGASGLGLGTYSIVNFQLVEGPQGLPGDDGQDAPGGLLVGILDPDNGETVSGSVTIEAIVYGSEDYTISVLRNGTEIGTSIPMAWDTTSIGDGWWNITVILTDTVSENVVQDQVLTYVKNVDIEAPIVTIYDPSENDILAGNITIRALVQDQSEYTLQVLINDKLNATSVPYIWDSSKVNDGWYNITVIAIDDDGNIGIESIFVYISNEVSIKAYIKLRMTDYQTVNTGHTVQFNYTIVSYKMNRVGNGVSLESGKTYRIEAALNIYHGAAGGFLGYQLHNGNSFFGSVAYSQYPGGDTSFGFIANILEFYTPFTDMVITVRITDDNIGLGQINPHFNTYFIVMEL